LAVDEFQDPGANPDFFLPVQFFAGYSLEAHDVFRAIGWGVPVPNARMRCLFPFNFSRTKIICWLNTMASAKTHL
jgi:hypothetical protein